MKTRILYIALFATVLALAGCDRASGASSSSGDEDGPVAVASTTMLEDLAHQLGGDDVQVEGIMSPGGDPHLYQPTPADARLIARSDMVIRNGLKLEGWIDDLLENAGGERPIITASDGVKPIKMDDEYGVDPHIWFELDAWKIATKNVRDALVDLVGPETEAAENIRKRAEAYLATLDRLDQWVRDQLATIPESRRVLITSHDAFNYFGRAYDIDVVAIQGISTEQEAGQRDIANTVELVRKRNAPAVFVETSVNPSLIEQVARETGVEVAGPLYSDSIGAADTPAGTFVGTVQENVRMITQGLGGDYEPFDAPEGGGNE